MAADTDGSEERRAAEFYDHFDPYARRPDIGFWVDEARRSGGPVLELGCGTGRVLVPIACAGIQITGLDRSAAMLDHARRAIARQPEAVQLRARLVEGDMRQFDLDRSFALAVFPFRSFQCLVTTEDQLACLECTREHLAPDGRIILDLFNPSLHYLVDPDRERAHAVGEPFTLPDGRRVVRSDRIARRDYAAQVQDVELIYDVTHPDGSTEQVVDAFPMRYTFRYEAEHLLARMGFELEHVYCDYERAEFGATYPGELIIVARRR